MADGEVTLGIQLASRYSPALKVKVHLCCHVCLHKKNIVSDGTALRDERKSVFSAKISIRKNFYPTCFILCVLKCVS